ncbi:MAG: hypothetical protein WC895_05390, partial [Candidatus Shapirobacteria bacterium]
MVLPLRPPRHSNRLINVFFVILFLLSSLLPPSTLNIASAQRLPKGNACPVVTGKPYRSPTVTTVFVVTSDCKKRPIFNPSVYFSHYASWSDVIFLEKKEIDAIPDHPLHFMPWGPRRTFENNSLVKVTTDPRVYLLVGTTRYPFENEAAFKSFGFTFDQIEDVTDTVLSKYQKNPTTLKTPNDAPPSFVFKYSNDPKVFVLTPQNGSLVKSHIQTIEDLKKLARADRIGIFAPTALPSIPEGTPTGTAPSPPPSPPPPQPPSTAP